MACLYQLASAINNPNGPGLLLVVNCTPQGAASQMQFEMVVQKSDVVPSAGIDPLPFVQRLARAVHSGQITKAQALLVTETY